MNKLLHNMKWKLNGVWCKREIIIDVGAYIFIFVLAYIYIKAIL